MDLKRFWRHAWMSPLRAAASFPPSTMEAIAREVAAQEKRHRGELAFVVEAELATAQLWRGMTPRDRAREVFAAHGVWNTEENSGVLIYILLADHAVEIVADRGISARVSESEWRGICAAMEAHFRARRFEAGALEGIRAASDLLARHFPADARNPNELPDRPVLL
jgi:uncharacterized membrane protein